MSKNNIYAKAKKLSKETKVWLLFCYKALKYFEDDYKRAFDYLMSKEFKNSIHTKNRYLKDLV